MKTKVLLMVAIATILLTSLTACEFEFGFNWDDFKYRYEETLDGSLEGVEEFAITIRNGRILVETWDKDEFLIDVEEGIKASNQETADEMAEEINLVGNKRGKSYIVEIDYGKFHNKKKRHACHVTVKVPERLALKLHTTNGRIEVEEMEGDVLASSTNGSIEVDGAKGNVNLSTTNGSVNAMKIQGRLEADTTNGKLTLHSISGEVEADTTNGRIEITIENPLEGGINADTTNGSIELTLASGSEFSISASTTNGGISDNVDGGDFNYNKRRTSMNGKVGSGKSKITLSTTNGSITINMD